MLMIKLAMHMHGITLSVGILSKLAYYLKSSPDLPA